MKASSANRNLLVSALLVGALATQYGCGAVAKAGFEAQLKAESDSINKTLPKQMAPGVELEKTVVSGGDKITYYYNLKNVESNPQIVEALTGEGKKQAIEQYKTNPDLKKFRENNVTMVYVYKDKNGQTIGEISMSPKDF